MADDPPPRSRAAREAAERALVRIVHHYEVQLEFVVLGELATALGATKRSRRLEHLREGAYQPLPRWTPSGELSACTFGTVIGMDPRDLLTLPDPKQRYERSGILGGDPVEFGRPPRLKHSTPRGKLWGDAHSADPR